MSSNAETNRVNAHHSTGPATEAGKQRSSLNALRHGLAAQTAVLPTEGSDAHESHLKTVTANTESNLVQALADPTSPLNQIPTSKPISRFRHPTTWTTVLHPGNA